MKRNFMLFITIALAAVMSYGGVALTWFAEADDAPGGVVIGWAIVVGAVALAVKALQQRRG